MLLVVVVFDLRLKKVEIREEEIAEIFFVLRLFKRNNSVRV